MDPPSLKDPRDLQKTVAAISPAGLNQADLVGEIIADAFDDDPVNRWVMNTDRGFAPIYCRLARHVYLKRGFSDLAGDGSGATMWLPPGEKSDLPWWAFPRFGIILLQMGGLTALSRGIRADTAMAAHHPREPCYYLFAIGVRPGNQGRGIGGQLIRTGLARAERDGMPAYLENTKEQNLAFYYGAGFEVLEEFRFGEGAPPVWAMWRPARLNR